MVKPVPPPKKKTVHADLSPKSDGSNEGPSFDTILLFAGRLINVRTEIDEKRDVERKIKQQAKNAGLTIEDLNEAIKIADTGIDAVFARFQRIIRYTTALGAPIGKQLALFEDVANRSASSQETLLKDAEQKGRSLGILGLDPDGQAYPSNTDLGQAHLTGWHAGQKFRFDELTANSEAAAAKEEADKKHREEVAERKTAEKAAKEAQKQQKRDAKIAKKAEDNIAEAMAEETTH